MDGCNSLFTVFSDSKNTTFDSVQFSNYHSTEMIVQRPGGDLVIRGMIANAISGVLVSVSEGVESVTVEDVMMLKCDKTWKKSSRLGSSTNSG